MPNLSRKLKVIGGLLTATSIAGLASAGNMPGYIPDLVPPNPQPGVCYARVEIPAQYTTQMETVITEEGYNTVDIRQPQIQSTQKQFVSKEASVRYEVRQPRYSTVSEKILVSPGYDKLSVTPPRFNTVTETITTSAPRLVWKRGNPGRLIAQGYKIHSTADAGAGGRGYSSTRQYGQTGGDRCGVSCEIWCLVEEPGDSMTFQRKVMSAPAQISRTPIPPRYQTIMKQVVADPGGVREIPVPAQHRTITVKEMLDPGGQEMTSVPPKYGQVEKKVLIAPERYEWRQVQCAPGTRRNVAAPVHTQSYETPAPQYLQPYMHQRSVQQSSMPMAPTVCNTNHAHQYASNGVCSTSTYGGSHSAGGSHSGNYSYGGNSNSAPATPSYNNPYEGR